MFRHAEPIGLSPLAQLSMVGSTPRSTRAAAHVPHLDSPRSVRSACVQQQQPPAPVFALLLFGSLASRFNSPSSFPIQSALLLPLTALSGSNLQSRSLPILPASFPSLLSVTSLSRLRLLFLIPPRHAFGFHDSHFCPRQTAHSADIACDGCRGCILEGGPIVGVYYCSQWDHPLGSVLSPTRAKPKYPLPASAILEVQVRRCCRVRLLF